MIHMDTNSSGDDGGRVSAVGSLAILSDILSAHGKVGLEVKSEARSLEDSESPSRADCGMVHTGLGRKGTAIRYPTMPGVLGTRDM